MTEVSLCASADVKAPNVRVAIQVFRFDTVCSNSTILCSRFCSLIIFEVRLRRPARAGRRGFQSLICFRTPPKELVLVGDS